MGAVRIYGEGPQGSLSRTDIDASYVVLTGGSFLSQRAMLRPAAQSMARTQNLCYTGCMKKLFVCAVMLAASLCQTLGAQHFTAQFPHANQAVEDDVPYVLAGVLAALERGANTDGKTNGKNSDSSLTWHWSHADPSMLLIAFNGYKFYLPPDYAQERRLWTLNGNISFSIDDAILNGKVSVEGSETVSVIELRYYEYFGEWGLALVNNALYGNEKFNAAFDEAYVLSNYVIDVDFESVLVFVAALYALEATDIEEKLDYPEIIPGITAQSPDGTVSIVTQENAMEITCVNFAIREPALYISATPLISSTITMKIAMDGKDMTSIILDGNMTVENCLLVTSVSLEGCSIQANMKEAAGVITINGNQLTFAEYVFFLSSGPFSF